MEISIEISHATGIARRELEVLDNRIKGVARIKPLHRHAIELASLGSDRAAGRSFDTGIRFRDHDICDLCVCRANEAHGQTAAANVIARPRSFTRFAAYAAIPYYCVSMLALDLNVTR